MSDNAMPSPRPRSWRLVLPRLFIGFIILTCAEFFSGASVGQNGMWAPWTWIVTFWLYFAHFFFFTTLAVWTGRTSLSALYLWGVLFGLYESWITKVIWAGYGVEGHAFGTMGPYGYAEFSMVVIFHPVVSFLIPLAVACVIYPSLRRHFPGLAWLTGRTRRARAAQIYLAFSLIPVMAANGGGPVNFATNLAFTLAVLFILRRGACWTFDGEDALPVVAFGRVGFTVLCLYLALLYGVTYPLLRPEGLPSATVQLLTFVWYALALWGLWAHRRRTPLETAEVSPDEGRRIVWIFGIMLGGALALSPLNVMPVVLFVPILPGMLAWTLLGFVFLAMALWQAFRERGNPSWSVAR